VPDADRIRVLVQTAALARARTIQPAVRAANADTARTFEVSGFTTAIE